MACAQYCVSAGVDKTISRVLFLRCYFVPGTRGILHFSKRFRNVGVFCSYLSLKTARLATTLGSLCAGTSLGCTLSSKFGREACRVSRAHVPCVMRCFCLKKKKPPVQIGATLSLRTWVRAPASIFVIAFFFLLFHLFLRAGNFAQALYQVGTYLGISWELHGSPQLLPCLFRDRCEVYLVLSWARVPCVACACAVRSALYFFPSKK